MSLLVSGFRAGEIGTFHQKNGAVRRFSTTNVTGRDPDVGDRRETGRRLCTRGGGTPFADELLAIPVSPGSYTVRESVVDAPS
jgi:hypothetical protein